MASRSALRASDADRESVAERLRAAAAEGRLLTEELEQRLEAAFSARTYGQLDVVLADLPGTSSPRGRSGLGVARSMFALAFVLTIAVVVIVAVLFVITGVLAGWLLWIVFAWLFMARRGRMHRGRGGPLVHACGGYAPRRSRRLSA